MIFFFLCNFVQTYKKSLTAGIKFDTEKWQNVFTVEKTKIAETGDYNLSGDRYRVATDYTNAKWPMITIEEICELGRGRVISKKDMENNPGTYPVYSSQTTDSGIFGYLGTYDLVINPFFYRFYQTADLLRWKLLKLKAKK